MSAIKEATKTWPVSEIFGPTLQGEGVDQGVVSHFIRFGGCDYKCDWCDTPYAVLPEEVRQSRKLSSKEIVEDLHLRPFAPWVILTGGNPALHDLATLVKDLQDRRYFVAIETQGSKWREWMRNLDRVCVSPKPPSANEPRSSIDQLHKFMYEGMEAKLSDHRPYEWLFLKIVCFTEEDLDYAEKIRSQLGDFMLFLSAGNDAGRTVANPTRVDNRSLEEVRGDLLNKARWLTDEVLKRPALKQADVFVQSQFHTLLWGNGRGF